MVYYSYDITPQEKYMFDDYGVVGTLLLRSRKKALSSTQFFFLFFFLFPFFFCKLHIIHLKVVFNYCACIFLIFVGLEARRHCIYI
jgi:hypothetical protein